MLNDKSFHRALFYLAKLISLTIADIEWRHGRRRKRAHACGQTRYSTVAASSINADASALHKARKLSTPRQPPRNNRYNSPILFHNDNSKQCNNTNTNFIINVNVQTHR